MTVAELIAWLEEHDPELPVVVGLDRSPIIGVAVEADAEDPAVLRLLVRPEGL